MTLIFAIYVLCPKATLFIRIHQLVGWLIGVERPTNSLGHMETGPQFIVPSDGLEKPGSEPATPGLQGE